MPIKSKKQRRSTLNADRAGWPLTFVLKESGLRNAYDLH
jgi:hypothetical protein